MAGFTVLVAPGSAPEAVVADFEHALGLTAQYKQLEIPTMRAAGRDCFASKLDSPATIHPGIIHDPQTGSWLLAAGTVVSLEGDNNPTTILRTLLQGYIKNGEKALEIYDGHFALVIYNGLEESLSVVSDPIGLFSIFYGQRGNQIFISSSALAVARQIQSQPNVLAAEHFLRIGRLDGDRTLWQDVKRLLAARVLKITNGRVEQNEYWSPTFDESISRLSMEAALDQAVDLLSQTVSRALQREGKIWVDLTGGFDSRLAVMLVDKIQVPFITYCMGPADHPDVQLSKKISHDMRWEYIHSQLPDQWDLDQFPWFNTALGRGDGLASTLRLAVTLRGFTARNTTIKTNVMGVGGENWRGYYWQIENWNLGRTSNVNFNALIRNVFSTQIPISVMRHDRTREVQQELREYAKRLCHSYGEYPNTVQLDRFEIYRDAGHGGAYLSAAAGTGRTLAPFCFKDPVNFAISLNYRWKLPRHHSFIRSLLERENKLLASFATTTGGPAFPMRIANFYKFSPLWRNLTNRAVASGSKKLVGTALQIWPQPQQTGYPLPAWRKAFYTYAKSEGLLNYDTMCSSGLFKRREFNALIDQNNPASDHGSEFLDRVISIEMAMRAVGSSIN